MIEGKGGSMLKRLFVLASIVSLISFGCSGMGTGVKVVKHPGLDSGKPTGYVEMWVPTVFGMWMKNLEEGPATCDTIHVSLLDLGKDEYLCTTKVPSWPGNLDSIKNRPIADNFSVCRFEMPAGEYEIKLVPDPGCYPEGMAQKFKSGGYAAPGMTSTTYTVPAYRDKILVEANAVNLFMLDFWYKDDEAFSVAWAPDPTVLLPVPEKPLKIDPYPIYYDSYIKLLEDPHWGFRWYAAKRLRFIGNESTVPIIEERLKVEEHKDVRNELEKALKKLGN